MDKFLLSIPLRSRPTCKCSLAAIFEVLGVDDENVVRAATGFADGVGLTGDGHCGALSGGTMAISYFFGRKKEDLGKVGRQLKALLLAKKFHEQFISEFSTCRCHDIQVKQFGRFFNLYDMEDMKAAMAAGLPVASTRAYMAVTPATSTSHAHGRS